MAQTTIDQGADDGEAKKDVQQKEDISLTQYEDGSCIQLDPHGLPLIPQPSQWKDDPLVGASVPCLVFSRLQY